ncbi:MAG: hypothetical protein AB7O96_15330 [Pseudobdellovibrionaceae bacterium]
MRALTIGLLGLNLFLSACASEQKTANVETSDVRKPAKATFTECSHEEWQKIQAALFDNKVRKIEDPQGALRKLEGMMIEETAGLNPQCHSVSDSNSYTPNTDPHSYAEFQIFKRSLLFKIVLVTTREKNELKDVRVTQLTHRSTN